MKDITVIIPILLDAYQLPLREMLDKAVDSVRAAAKNYTGGKVKLLVVRPSDETTDDPMLRTFLTRGDLLTTQRDAAARIAQEFARQIVDDVTAFDYNRQGK